MKQPRCLCLPPNDVIELKSRISDLERDNYDLQDVMSDVAAQKPGLKNFHSFNLQL